ncbi:MAG TPA: ATP phosphoribosyltransferase regulatory subunit [Dongiaceae bacterium]|jgi:ATP phosphoribosyltransferase regulatory subunit|nr:ATP phosphoribosyltransferase regulatory subunit [Dongiaceae bacterium]
MATDEWLLPQGFVDLLPPFAEHEAATIARFMAFVRTWGYDRIEPPLIEFEETLLSGPGAAMRTHTFRVMDPVSHRMMGVRADITPQIGRMAASRLRHKSRPLRLSYAGPVLRTRAEQLRSARQLAQIGAELIGSSADAADAEIITLACEALSVLGIADVTIDINLPRLVPIALGERLDPSLAAALDRKDRAAIAATQDTLLGALIATPAAIAEGTAHLRALSLGEVAEGDIARLETVAAMVQDARPEARLTLDATDRRGFEYHSGLGFALFARGVVGELGRGGRYETQAGETATGFSLYLDRLVEVLPAPASERRLFTPAGMPPRFAPALREEGWITVRGLEPIADPEQEAKRLGCSHYWLAGSIAAVSS